MYSPELITFKKLQSSDLSLLHIWLNEPHVHEWYDKDKQNTYEDIKKRYGPKINREQPTDCYLVLYKKEQVGYIQTYKVNDWPEFGDYVGCDDGTASIDLFIGEKTFLGKGFGSLMLKRFLQDIVFTRDGITSCIIGPEPKNARAIRAYEKAGFTYHRTVQVGDEPNLTYIMKITKGKVLHFA